MSYAPVVIFGYKRPKHLYHLLNSLEKCEYSNKTDVFIFVDGARREEDKPIILETYKIANMDRKFRTKKVIRSDYNKGLANSVIDGVTEIINKFGKVIVLEDDLIVNKNFLRVMNNMLDFYEQDEKIWSISGYSFPIDTSSIIVDWYAVKRASSWGWASWHNRWNKIEWDMNALLTKNAQKLKSLYREIPDSKMMIYNYKKGFIDSWALRWTLNQYFLDKISLSPKYSLLRNNGFDSSGTHGSMRKDYNKNYLPNFEPKSEKYVNSETINELFRDFCKPTIYNNISFILKKLNLYKPIKELLRR
jgi:hypothetical protein